MKMLLLFFPLISIPASASSQRLIIVRHGEAKQNILKIVNSNVENSKKYPLTDKGREKVTETAKKLKSELNLTDAHICKVFISPLLRTQQTAEILIEQLEIDPKKLVVENDIREIHTGAMEEHSEKEIEERSPTGVTSDWSNAHQWGGETNRDVSKRLAKFLKKLKKLPQDQSVIVVTHGLPAMELFKLFGDKSPAMPEKGEYRILP